MKAPVPSYILTGMLGAGKTTLLNRILRDPGGYRFAVLVNEFGSIDVDGEFIETTDGPQLSLTNGCICCTIRDDFEEAICGLLRRNPDIDYLVIEASGVADPNPIANTFVLSESLRELVRLDSVIAVVDLEGFPLLKGEPAYLARRQVAAADLVLLNKVDLVGEKELASVEASLDRWVPRLRTFRSSQGQVSLELLLGNTRFQPEQLPEGPSVEVHVHTVDSDCHHHHSEGQLTLESWTYRESGAFRTRALASILKSLPAEVYRAKGFVSLQDEQEPVFQVQLCGTRLDIRAAGPNKKVNGLVFLAEEGALDFDELKASLTEAMMPSEEEAVSSLRGGAVWDMATKSASAGTSRFLALDGRGEDSMGCPWMTWGFLAARAPRSTRLDFPRNPKPAKTRTVNARRVTDLFEERFPSSSDLLMTRG